MHRRITIAYLLAAAVLAVALTGCSSPQKAAEPAEAVQQLLSLRYDGETDPKVYRLYLPNDELASALASDSASRESTRRPTPEWGAPRVYNETTATADVKVVWQRSKVVTPWPEATVFKVVFEKGAWVVVDAVDVTADAIPKRDAPRSTPVSGQPPAGAMPPAKRP